MSTAVRKRAKTSQKSDSRKNPDLEKKPGISGITWNLFFSGYDSVFYKEKKKYPKF